MLEQGLDFGDDGTVDLRTRRAHPRIVAVQPEESRAIERAQDAGQQGPAVTVQQFHMRVRRKSPAGGGIELIVQLDRHDPGGDRGEGITMSPRNVPVSTTVDAPDRRKCALTIRCLTIGGAGMRRPRRCHFQYTRHSVNGRIHGSIVNLRQSVSTSDQPSVPRRAHSHLQENSLCGTAATPERSRPR